MPERQPSVDPALIPKSSGPSLAGNLKRHLYALGLVTALAALASAQQPQLGMTVRGMVRSAEGVPCVDCRVIAYSVTLRRVITAKTNSNGEFRLEHLPAGPYNLSVIDALGNSTPLSWVHDGETTRAASSDVHLEIQERINVEGVVLDSPPPTAVLTEEQIRAFLGPAQVSAARASVQAGTPFQVACPQPTPTPVDYPPSPDPSTRTVFAARRGPDELVGPNEDPCNKATALGCTEANLERIRRNVPSDGLPVCRADGLLILGTDLIQTTIKLRPPNSPRYNNEPPDAPGCVEILKPDCGGRPGYHSFKGGQVHECTHRTLDEQKVAKLFDKFLASIKRIQAEIDAKGRCYNCCLLRVADAISAYQDYRAGVGALQPDEPPAYAAECAYYKSNYEAFCRGR